MSKRARTDAPEPGTGGWSKKRSMRSMVTPIGSSLKVGPVEAGSADVAVAHADAADHDVVAAFGVELVVLAAADEDVVADDRIVAERIEVVARRAVGRAALDPVVAFVAHILFVGLAAEDEVVARAAEGLEASSPVTMKSLPKPPMIRLMPLPPWMTSLPSPPWMLSSPPVSVMMSSPAPPEAGRCRKPPSMPVVAAIAPERVVAIAGDDDVVAGGAAEHDVVLAGVLQVVGRRAGVSRVVADDQRREQDRRAGRVRRLPSSPRPVNCLRLVDLEREGRRREDERPADAWRRCSP